VVRVEGMLWGGEVGGVVADGGRQASGGGGRVVAEKPDLAGRTASLILRSIC